MTNRKDTPTGCELPSVVLEDVKALESALAKANRLRQEVNDAASRVPDLKAQVQDLEAKQRLREGDLALAEDSELKAIQTDLKKIGAELDAKSRELNRTESLIVTLESRAADIDGAVHAAISVVEQSLIAYSDAIVESLREEIREKVKPLQGIMQALRVLSPIAAGNVKDILSACFVPEPDGFMRIMGPEGWRNIGTNLLDVPPDEAHAATANALSEALAPLRDSIRTAKALPAYVPLAKRPRPYAIKGYTHDGVKGNARPFGAPSEASQQSRMQGPAPLPKSTGRVREGYAGELPPGTALDGNVAPALVNNLMRTHGGSEFAV
jgi:hypothetical protein